MSKHKDTSQVTRIERPAMGWDIQRKTTHPGEMLLEEFLKPLHLSIAETARRAHLPIRLLADIVRERKPMTAEVALRLERLFGMSADFWLRLQHSHDLTKARLLSGKAIQAEIDPIQAQAVAA